MRPPEEIYRYGKDVIEKHRDMLFSLNNSLVQYVIDPSTNQKFYGSNYGDWKHEVKDYIKKHEPGKIGEIDSLFYSFELSYSQKDLNDILGILYVSVGNLKSEDRGGSPDNSQMTQTTNKTDFNKQTESEIVAANPPKENKKVSIWKRVFRIILFIIFIAIITGVLIRYFDNKMIVVIATIVGAVGTLIAACYTVLSYYK